MIYALIRWRIERFMRNYQQPALPVTCVVLMPGDGGRQVAAAALKVNLQSNVRKFVLSGLPHEVAEMRAILIAGDIPAAKIVVEVRATNTPENGKYSALLVRDRRTMACVIVKQRFHLLRCKMCYKWFGFRNLVLWPCDTPEDAMKDIARGTTRAEARFTVSNWFRLLLGRV